MIVLDTSILSLAFRGRPEGSETPRRATVLRELIVADAPLAAPGIVLQELLSGVRGEAQFRRLRAATAGFPLLLATEADHLRAARIGNDCHRRGTSCAAVDALIAAMTVERDGRLFTADADFERIADCCGLKLFSPPA